MFGWVPVYTPRAQRARIPPYTQLRLTHPAIFFFDFVLTANTPPPFKLRPTTEHYQQAYSKKQQDRPRTHSSNAAAAKPRQRSAMSNQRRVLGIVRAVLWEQITESELVDLRTGFLAFYSDLELDLECADDPEEVQKQMAECCEEIAVMSDHINTVRALFCSHK